MEPYVDETYYKENYLGTLDTEDLAKRLKEASQQVDMLTFNRIRGKGFDNLTSFQQSVIKEVICQHVDFVYENQDMIDSVLQSYSINGVSMSFGQSWNIEVMNGVAMKRSTYELLKQTGLTRSVI
jgi:hypothetical protein